MVESLGGAGHVGAVGVDRQHLLVAAQYQVAAHAGGEVEHDVDARGADALDRLGVELGGAGALAGLRVADVDVHDRGPGLGGIDRRRRRSARA